MFNPTTRSILENIFFVKRIDVMIEIFRMCLKMACAFKGTGPAVVYDTNRLNQPIKKYIADYVHRLMLGVGPYSVSLILCKLLQRNGLNIESEIDLNDIGAQSKTSLDELVKKGIDLTMKSGQFPINDYNQAASLCDNMEKILRKKADIISYQETINCQTFSMNQTQRLLSAFNWIHEEVVNATTSQRPAFIHQLKVTVQKLESWKNQIQKLREIIVGFICTSVQRLKWAAGANPALSDLLNGFETLSTIKREQLDQKCLLAAVALKSCTSVLNYELLRQHTAECLEQDQVFLNLVSRWEKSCMMSVSCATAVNSVEIALVELLDPEGMIDHNWLSDVAGLIDNMTEQTQAEIVNFEKDIVDSQDNLQKCGHRLRSLLFHHHRISSDVITLLKTTMKTEVESNGRTRDYLMRYKSFWETISELQGAILSKDFTEEIVKEILQQIQLLLNNVKDVYDDLFWFENDVQESPKNDGGDKRNCNSKPQTSADVYAMSPAKKQKGKFLIY